MALRSKPRPVPSAATAWLYQLGWDRTVLSFKTNTGGARPNRRGSLQDTKGGCLRCLLLVMCTYPIAKEALTLHLARGEGRERYLGCNLMQRKVLASSHQHLMAEAPVGWSPRISRTPPGFEISAPFAFSDTTGLSARIARCCPTIGFTDHLKGTSSSLVTPGRSMRCAVL